MWSPGTTPGPPPPAALSLQVPRGSLTGSRELGSGDPDWPHRPALMQPQKLGAPSQEGALSLGGTGWPLASGPLKSLFLFMQRA